MGVAYSLDLFQFLDVGLDYFHLLEEAFDFLLVLFIRLLQSLHLYCLNLHLYPHVGQFLLKLADNFLPRYAFIWSSLFVVVADDFSISELLDEFVSARYLGHEAIGKKSDVLEDMSLEELEIRVAVSSDCLDVTFKEVHGDEITKSDN